MYLSLQTQLLVVQNVRSGHTEIHECRPIATGEWIVRGGCGEESLRPLSQISTCGHFVLADSRIIISFVPWSPLRESLPFWITKMKSEYGVTHIYIHIYIYLLCIMHQDLPFLSNRALPSTPNSISLTRSRRRRRLRPARSDGHKTTPGLTVRQRAIRRRRQARPRGACASGIRALVVADLVDQRLAPAALDRVRRERHGVEVTSGRGADVDDRPEQARGNGVAVGLALAFGGGVVVRLVGVVDVEEVGAGADDDAAVGGAGDKAVAGAWRGPQHRGAEKVKFQAGVLGVEPDPDVDGAVGVDDTEGGCIHGRIDLLIEPSITVCIEFLHLTGSGNATGVEWRVGSPQGERDGAGTVLDPEIETVEAVRVERNVLEEANVACAFEVVAPVLHLVSAASTLKNESPTSAPSQLSISQTPGHESTVQPAMESWPPTVSAYSKDGLTTAPIVGTSPALWGFIEQVGVGVAVGV